MQANALSISPLHPKSVSVDFFSRPNGDFSATLTKSLSLTEPAVRATGSDENKTAGKRDPKSQATSASSYPEQKTSDAAVLLAPSPLPIQVPPPTIGTTDFRFSVSFGQPPPASIERKSALQASTLNTPAPALSTLASSIPLSPTPTAFGPIPFAYLDAAQLAANGLPGSANKAPLVPPDSTVSAFPTGRSQKTIALTPNTGLRDVPAPGDNATNPLVPDTFKNSSGKDATPSIPASQTSIDLRQADGAIFSTANLHGLNKIGGPEFAPQIAAADTEAVGGSSPKAPARTALSAAVDSQSVIPTNQSSPELQLIIVPAPNPAATALADSTASQRGLIADTTSKKSESKNSASSLTGPTTVSKSDLIPSAPTPTTHDSLPTISTQPDSSLSTQPSTPPPQAATLEPSATTKTKAAAPIAPPDPSIPPSAPAVTGQDAQAVAVPAIPPAALATLSPLAARKLTGSPDKVTAHDIRSAVSNAASAHGHLFVETPAVNKAARAATDTVPGPGDAPGKKAAASAAQSPGSAQEAQVSRVGVDAVIVAAPREPAPPAPPPAPEVRPDPSLPPPPVPSTAPDLTLPTARLATNAAGEVQMHVGLRTAAFGVVEIYTSVHQNQVGLVVHGERGMEHWFGSEMQNLESGLQNHHLHLTTIEIDNHGTGLQTSTGSQQDNPQRNTPRAWQTQRVAEQKSDKPLAVAPVAVVARPLANRVSIHI